MFFLVHIVWFYSNLIQLISILASWYFFLCFSLASLIRANLQVYVIRANDLNEVDGALSLLNLETLTKQSDAG